MTLPSYWDILAETGRRVADAVLAQSGVQSNSARAALRQMLAGPPGAPDSLLGQVVFEPASVWQSDGSTTGALASTLLSDAVVRALDTARPEVRLPRDRSLYTHQVAAWRAALTGPRRSWVVTSGTGSGKTECFLIPVLQDLNAQAPHPGGGVQAILLYPLNALIESQRRRLDGWLAGLGGRLRYALYKGDFPERMPAGDRRAVPAWEVPDRESLRARPPEILVTNLTMLEYMTVRPQDQPILARSQGRLRWIILDEAHSYAGAQAAELAMLLRRVRHAFGVAADQVRILATSATLGKGSDDDLRQFIAGLADAPVEAIDVIHGVRSYAALPAADPAATAPDDHALAQASPAQAFACLGAWPPMRAVIAKLRGAERISLQAADQSLGGNGTPQTLAHSMALMEVAGRAALPEAGRLAPWRLHAFLRAQPGFWSCCDPDCPHNATQMGAGGDWPFGKLYVAPRERCDCGAPVFEIEQCENCARPRLRVQITGSEPPALIQRVEVVDDDDYALDIEAEEDDADPVPTDAVLLPPAGDVRLLDARQATLFDGPPPPGVRTIRVNLVEPWQTRHCCAQAQAGARRARFGAPSLLGAAISPLLRAAGDEVERHAADLPAFGRRVLSFTDSRQGTARLSAKLQQEAERALVRAVIWHAVSEPSPEPPNAAEIREQLAALRPVAQGNAALMQMVQDKEAELGGALAPVPWRVMVQRLANNTELRVWATRTWRSALRSNGDFGKDANLLAEMLLLRETLRRPKFLNSVETLGMAALRFAGLEQTNAPRVLVAAGRSQADWQDFLRHCVDFSFRQNLAAKIDERTMRWASPGKMGALPFYAPPGGPSPARPGRAWPTAEIGDRSRLVHLARLMLRLDDQSPASRDLANDLLTAAWNALRTSRTIVERNPGEWVLDYATGQFVPCAPAWRCPVTRRVLSYAPLGQTPYADRPAVPMTLPALPIPKSIGLGEAERDQVRQWLLTDPEVAAVRAAGMWDNLHDRAAGFEPFFRSAEHSAQLGRPALKRYELEFEKGELNLLNCSTTMEMGVDIAGVSVVLNTNVPPSPANYRQRIGRAGRRGEPRALAMTFCKDNPRDWAAFEDPEAALLAADIAGPRIRLDSAVIVARHVNAFYLAAFLNSSAPLRLPMGVFLGGPAMLDQPFNDAASAAVFLERLRRIDGFSAELDSAARLLTRGTALAGVHDLRGRVAASFAGVAARWRGEWQGIVDAAVAFAPGDPAYRALANRLKRLHNEFMLIELSKRGFTPAYGFPINVVSFHADAMQPTEAATAPSRSMDIAIREYAPGADVVVDGLVYKSSGIALAWSQPHELSDVEDLRRAWRCTGCGTFGLGATTPAHCPDCGAATAPDFETLRPAGFASDAEPHARYELAQFIKPADPWVSARGGAPRALPDPSVGLMRTARAGSIFHHTGGPGGFGYAICLACGRAEPEQAKDADAPPPPAAIADHYPLGRRARRGDRCEGPTTPWMIRRHTRLGAETTTDVFELALHGLPANDQGRRAGLAIGSALREALARRIGIDAQDMGVLARLQGEQAGTTRVLILLYDRDAGGAGFAPLAAEDTAALLQTARLILDCPGGEACVTACPRCVLARDLHFDFRALDRRAALDFLDAQVLPKLVPPNALKVFGPSTWVETRALTEVIDIALARGAAQIDLFLQGEPRDWELVEWPVRRILRGGRGTDTVRLIATPGALLGLTTGQKLALDRWLAETGASLLQTPTLPKAPDDRPILARLSRSGGETTEYCAGDPLAAMIGPDWGSVARAPLPCQTTRKQIVASEVPIGKLLELGRENARRIELGADLNGDVAGFGTRFWARLRRETPQLHIPLTSQRILRVSYRDRYLVTPLVVRLLTEVVRTLAAPRGIDSIAVTTAPPSSGGSLQGVLWSSWPRAETRDGVLRTMLTPWAKAVRIGTQSARDVPHDRLLEVEWQSARLALTLDQGFGAWRARGSPDFDFAAAAPAQAAKLESLTFEVRLDADRTPIVLEYES